MRTILTLLFFISYLPSSQAETNPLAMSELQPLLATHQISLQYPLTLFFNQAGEHVYTHAGSHEKPVNTV